MIEIVESPLSKEPQSSESMANTFRKAWITSTADNNLTLHGFRRFKTTHLMNLRFLEDEIAKMDRILYQVGLKQDMPLSSTDRLGLGHSRKDANVPKIDDAITPEFIVQLRSLLKQYGKWHIPRIDDLGELTFPTKMRPLQPSTAS